MAALFAAQAFILIGAACSLNSTRDGEQARETFRRNCAGCHGADGRGRMLGPQRVPDLSEQRVKDYTDAQLFDAISRGNRNMPAFRHSMDESQIKELISFIREDIQKAQAR